MGEAIVRRLELVPKLTDPYEIGDIHAMAAWWALSTGRYREAAGFADRGVREAQAGSPAQGLYCLDFRTAAHFRLGDWDATLADVAVAEEVLGERRETPPGFAPQYLVIAAFIHDARGERAVADRYLQLVGWLEGVEDLPDTVVALWRSRSWPAGGGPEAAPCWNDRGSPTTSGAGTRSSRRGARSWPRKEHGEMRPRSSSRPEATPRGRASPARALRGAPAGPTDRGHRRR